MKRLLLTALAAITLTACASDPVPVARWSKSGGTQAAFVDTREQCVHTAKAALASYYKADERSPGGANGIAEFFGDVAADFGGLPPRLEPDGDMYRRCMNGHGWSLDPKGFAPPAGDEVDMGY
ncbi:MAG: hypothetical protein ABSD74_02335 [Rhizomicrobium sp.]